MSLREYIAENELNCIKLHLGCGDTKWKDFINIDLYPYDELVTDTSRGGCVADVSADIRDLGLSDRTVDEIFTSHTIDHFTRWEAIEMLRDWYRMLKTNGLLIIESADFMRCILWLFHPIKAKRKLALDQFYGNQWDCLDYQTHRYLWSAREIRNVLLLIGFREVNYTHNTLTHYPGRDMRITAVK